MRFLIMVIAAVVVAGCTAYSVEGMRDSGEAYSAEGPGDAESVADCMAEAHEERGGIDVSVQREQEGDRFSVWQKRSQVQGPDTILMLTDVEQRNGDVTIQGYIGRNQLLRDRARELMQEAAEACLE